MLNSAEVCVVKFNSVANFSISLQLLNSTGPPSRTMLVPGLNSYHSGQEPESRGQGIPTPVGGHTAALWPVRKSASALLKVRECAACEIYILIFLAACGVNLKAAIQGRLHLLLLLLTWIFPAPSDKVAHVLPFKERSLHVFYQDQV